MFGAERGVVHALHCLEEATGEADVGLRTITFLAGGERDVEIPSNQRSARNEAAECVYRYVGTSERGRNSESSDWFVRRRMSVEASNGAVPMSDADDTKIDTEDVRVGGKCTCEVTIGRSEFRWDEYQAATFREVPRWGGSKSGLLLLLLLLLPLATAGSGCSWE